MVEKSLLDEAKGDEAVGMRRRDVGKALAPRSVDEIMRGAAVAVLSIVVVVWWVCSDVLVAAILSSSCSSYNRDAL